MELAKLVEKNREAMVRTLQGAVRIKSVQEEALPGKPFGQGPARCLAYMLEEAEKMGFRTCNVDNYMGWCEYGEGPEMVAVLGHLDVVPEGDGWTRDPYGGETDGTNVYGRGTMDDKGPTTAALYALKALKDSGVPLKRRIRILFGTNEETGSRDMQQYLEQGGEIPVCGFTPDGEYPVINGEKGIINVTFEREYDQTGPLFLEGIKGGSAFNVVPALASAILRCEPAEGIRLLEKYGEKDPKVWWEVIPEGLKVTAQGVQAHAASPEKGENAIGRLLAALAPLPFDPALHQTLAFLGEKIGLEVHGESLGICLEDPESGKLSLNMGVIQGDAGKMTLKINYRYPVTKSYGDCAPKLDAQFADAGFQKVSEAHKKALYVDPRTDYIQTLLQVYGELTEFAPKTICIGGGTYAKSIPNIVAFGPIFPGDTVREHLPNEYWEIDKMVLNARIYAEALYRLAK